MKIKTKIFAVFLAASTLAFSMPLCAFALDEDDGRASEYEGYCTFFADMGISDFAVSQNYSEAVTRGEFIHNAYRLMNINSGENGDNPFWDMDLSYEYYGSILGAYNAGLIRGSDDSGIHCYDSVCLTDALAVTVRLLGYDTYADLSDSYSAGVLKAAKRADLDLTAENDAAITYFEMLRMLYTAANSNVFEQTAYGDTLTFTDYDTQTLLEKNFGIYEIEGVVAADSISALNADYEAVDNAVNIDSLIIRTDELSKRYIGMNVKCWYYLDSGGARFLRHIAEYDNNITVIADSNVGDLSGSMLGYYKNGAKKTVKFAKTAVFLYNGMPIDYENDYNAELFDIDEGEIVCIDNDRDSSADVVLINNYTNFIVSRYDTANGILFSEDNGIIDFGASDLKIRIFDTDGKAVKPESLKARDILSVLKSKDGKYIDITVSYNTFTAKADTVSTSGGVTSLNIKGAWYEAAYDCCSDDEVEMYLNVPAVFGINKFGRIAYIERVDSAGDDKFALLLSADSGENTLSNNSQIQILDNPDNEKTELYLADKVKLDGSTVRHYDAVSALWDGALRDGKLIAKFIRYTLNGEGKVDMIDTADKTDDESSQSITRVWTANDGALSYKKSGYFVMNYYNDDQTLFYGLPSDTEMNAGDFECECYEGLTNDGSYTPEIFAMGDKTVYMKAALVEKEPVGEKLVDEEAKLYAVSSMKYTTDDDGDTNVLLALISGSGEVEISVGPDERYLISELDIGDIVRYGVSTSGKLNAIQKIYDYSEKRFEIGYDLSGNELGRYSYQYKGTHDWVYAGTAYDVYDKFVKIALKGKADGDFTSLERSDIVNLEIKKAYVLKVSRSDEVSLEAVDENGIRTYLNSGSDAYEAVEIMQYKQHIDMMFIAEAE